MHHSPRQLRLRRSAIALYLACLLTGCGVTKSRTATEQLLASNAVDKSIAQLNFAALSGKKVFLDVQYLGAVKGAGFVNAPYIISSLRQQLIASNCLLQDSRDDADYVVEPRVGALGSDGHEINYGLPSNNAIGAAGGLLTSSPAAIEIPEISLAKKHDYRGVAKVSVFAYHRETREPVWQSGVLVGESSSKSVWVLGAGPFQQGSIHDGTQFAGGPIDIHPLAPLELHDYEEEQKVPAQFFSERNFQREREITQMATSGQPRSEETAEASPEESDVADESGEVAQANHEADSIDTPEVVIPEGTPES